MKKLFSILFLFILIGCSQTDIPSHLLVDNGGVFYESDSKKPFNGTSIENKDGMPFKRTYFSDGLITKVEEYYSSGSTFRTLVKEGDEFIAIVFDEEGNDISNKLNIFYHSNGSIKQKGQYTNGRKDGPWETYSLDGDLISREYWAKGTKLDINNFEELIVENGIIYHFDKLSNKTLYSGIVLIADDDEPATKTFISVNNGRRANLLEEYLASSGELISRSNCSYTNGTEYNETFFKFGFLFEDSVVELVECNSISKYKDYPDKFKSKISQYKTSDQWIYESTSFYKSGQIVDYKKYLLSPNTVNEYELVEAKIFYEDGNPHTLTFFENNELLMKRYSKSGQDISNGEDIGIEINRWPNESWHDAKSLKRGLYKNGKRNGAWANDVSSYTYKDGVLDGPTFTYLISSYKDADCLYSSGQHVDGKRHGEWYYYDVSYPYENCEKVDEVEVYDMGKEIK